MPVRHVFLALLVMAIWGFNFVVIKFSVDALPPMLAAGLRFVLAVFPFILFVRPPKVHWGLIILFGLTAGFGLYAFLNQSIAVGMPAGLASVVLQVQAFFTMIFAFFLLGERPGWRHVLGAVVAFGGIAAMASERLEGAGIWPFVLTICAAISWGMANVIAKMMGRADALAVTVWGALVSAITLLGFSAATEGVAPLIAFVQAPDLTTLGVLMFLAYAATLFGVGVWNWLLARHPASEVASFTLLVPVTGLLSGYLVLGETVSGAEFIGGCLIILGIGIVVVQRVPTFLKRRV